MEKNNKYRQGSPFIKATCCATIALTMLTACKDDDVVEENEPTTVVASSSRDAPSDIPTTMDEVQIDRAKEVYKSTICNIFEADAFWVTSDSEFGAFKQKLNSHIVSGDKQGTDLNPDFNENKILVIAMGTKPTPGYDTSLVNATMTGDSWEFEVTENAPNPDRMLAQVLTSPCTIIQVEANSPENFRVINKKGEVLYKL